MMNQHKIIPYYKQFNKIPRGWNLVKFGNVFHFLNSSSTTREYLTNHKTRSGIRCIHYGDIHAKFTKEILDLDEYGVLPFVKDGVEMSENISFLRDGDLVIADVSEDYAGIGECVELLNVKRKKIIGGLHTIVVRDRDAHTQTGFRCYIFRHPQVAKHLRAIATGISVYGISESNIAKIEIPLPPLPEQKAISAILSA